KPLLKFSVETAAPLTSTLMVGLGTKRTLNGKSCNTIPSFFTSRVTLLELGTTVTLPPPPGINSAPLPEKLGLYWAPKPGLVVCRRFAHLKYRAGIEEVAI